MIVVHPSVQAKTIKELIDLLKANPGKYSYASPGFGTTPHLACEWLFKVRYGIDVTHVPFQGAAPAVQSVLGGQTPIFHNVLPAVAPHIRSGAMRPLAIAAEKRSAFFPDVPTMAESGIPGHEVGFWLVVLMAAGTPKSIADTLNAQVAKILDLPDVKDRLQTIGFDPAASTSEAAAAHMRSETEKWTKVVRDANIKIE
jgi:tripartite-type tricarboxylate transporter receptor subunit TctC